MFLPLAPLFISSNEKNSEEKQAILISMEETGRTSTVQIIVT
jgi:hypothetical protein